MLKGQQGAPPKPAEVVWNYTYDAIYELTQTVLNGTTSETYTYDGVGNRLSSLGVSPYNYNSSNELTSKPGVTFAYDNNGNTTTKTDSTGTTSYSWDFENRLVSLTLPGGGIVNFKYDPFGRRIFKDAPTKTRIFVYDGDNIAERLDETGKATVRFTQGLGIDEPLATTASGVPDYYEADGLGSITSMTDATGATVNTYEYDSFGRLTGFNETVSNTFRYTAREDDGETKLYYYRARSYDPSVGRFLNEDPVTFSAGINYYVYVANDPVLLTDPTGLDPRKKCDQEKPCDLSKVKASPGDAITRDPAVLLQLYCLFVKAGYGFARTERGAWVVKNGDTYSLNLLPFTNEPEKITFGNRPPADTAAFGHTHPNPPVSGPKPSPADHIAANVLGMPVYVISSSAIIKALPQVKEPTKVAGEDWWRPLSKCKCD